MRPGQQPDQFADMLFPLHGLNLLQGFGSQPPGTTPVGLNVRTFEVLTQRGRGGSRPGLAKYIPGQIPGGPSKVQHLNVVVDPQGGALGDIDGGDFPDPSDAGPRRLWGVWGTRSPSRRVRRGGWGYMLYKNRRPRRSGVMYVQGNSGGFVNVQPSLQFTNSVTVGDLILVAVWTQGGAPGNPGTVTDTTGNAYALAATLFQGGAGSLSLWGAVAGSSDTPMISASVYSGLSSMALAEYAGVGPIEGTATHADQTNNQNWTVGPTPVALAGSLGVAVFGSNVLSYQLLDPTIAFTPGAGLTLRQHQRVRSGPATTLQSEVWLADAMNLSSPWTAAATGVAQGLAGAFGANYLALAATFLPASM